MRQELAELESYMVERGFDPSLIQLNTGRFVRFSRTNKNKKNGWFIGWSHSLSNGKLFIYSRFGDWSTNEDYIYTTEVSGSAEEQSEIRKKHKTAQDDYGEMKQAALNRAKRKASFILERGTRISSHPYLEAKVVRPSPCLRNYKGNIAVPMRNIDGDVIGVQLINAKGEKVFLRGQQVSGAFFVIGAGRDLSRFNQVYICEGLATGLSIFKAMKQPVICAFNNRNLVTVAKLVRKKHNLLKITICGDNDQFTEGNPGQTSAVDAALYSNSKCQWPTFMDLDTKPTDFNDLHALEGINTVKAQIENAKFIENECPPAAALAEEFISEFQLRDGEDLLIRFWKNDPYIYSKGKFIFQESADFESGVMRFLQNHHGARQKARKSLLSDVIANLKGIATVPGASSLPVWIGHESEPVRDLINMKNGLFNIRAWLGDLATMKEHTPNLFTTVQLPFSYHTDATCPIWENFLAVVQPDPEARNLIQEWFGLNLVWDISFQKFVIMVGEGANGKTVVCVVLRTLLGEQNVSSVNLESFDPKRTFPLAATVGKLANICGELNRTDRTAEGELKKYVSGEAITLERKHKDPFDYVPTARLTFATNLLPKFNDSSDGIWRRLIVIPFDVQISEAAQDKRLTSPDFWKESGELPGIFNWSLEGLKRLYATRQFSKPEASAKAFDQFRVDSTPSRTFLVETFERSEGSQISSQLVYDLYVDYMKSQGQCPSSQVEFNHEVRRTYRVEKSRNAVVHDGGRCHVWHGLRLRV